MEYYDAFQKLGSFREQTWFGKRQELVEQYSWAVPNDEAIELLVELSPLVEMGAGSGYWAYEIEQYGGSVEAFDIDPPSDDWFDVQYGEPPDLQNYDEPLLLCWPPYDELMAYDCLEYHAGDTVVYIGEGSGGCTGSKKFHNKLYQAYREIDVVQIPQYEGLHDILTVYEKV